MKPLFLTLLLAMSVSCATHRYGREIALTDAERASLTCEQIEVEIAKVEAFLADVTEGAPAGADVLAFLGDFGIGNTMEKSAARKSGEIRLQDLRELRWEKGCPGAEDPNQLGGGPLVIASLLPNPAGNDTQEEVITLRNDGQSVVDLSGWRLRDQSGRSVDLSIYGAVGPGATIDVVRSGSPLSLDDGGDVIQLLDAGGQAVDRVAYGPAAEGEVVQVR
jgi:hypothetical protein